MCERLESLSGPSEACGSVWRAGLDHLKRLGASGQLIRTIWRVWTVDLDDLGAFGSVWRADLDGLERLGASLCVSRLCLGWLGPKVQDLFRVVKVQDMSRVV